MARGGDTGGPGCESVPEVLLALNSVEGIVETGDFKRARPNCRAAAFVDGPHRWDTCLAPECSRSHNVCPMRRRAL